MANPFFRFKQFTVWHDKCGMKIGTDGVLLGAWTDVSTARHILDVGTGTGLVALMLAQRTSAPVLAIDIDEDAVWQAKENVASSPWSEQITCVQADYRLFEPSVRFDLIVSNPPFFVHSLKSPVDKRNIARHTDELSFAVLIEKSAQLLTPKGVLTLIIPTGEAENEVKKQAVQHGLHPFRQLYVCTKPDASPKRTLISFGFLACECQNDTIVIELERHVYSEAYKALTQDYYL